MHGNVATIEDIVLDLKPEPFDLYCREQLEDSDAEDETAVTQPDKQAFKVLSQCGGVCCKTVRLCVYSTHTGIRVLQELLHQDALQIVCPTCASRL
ncbi:transforming protein [Human papillomavirus type 54]|uniref:Protein E7 n=2 Tax=Human papillomavirus type 54 TaxID=1671798 RepID=VE7_HPV54|nr:transforming protein [Human papillomavirus type 54]Q81019.1 RecName: Full=Protein E7 [Human papillomavirus type 54]AAA79188.1 transforming protein [Human papillomavirus type 54]ALJ33016.1 early protein E7 [Human papillomavirus type 54]ALJ33030.1 early protein E7 [Human papillomavirus type 54]ALJ33044.1 early protein E7 [Human papillomavirus type 54]WBM83744.1 E7 protein [Human papillomavirus type 54]